MRDMLARRCFAVIGSILSETMLVYTSGVQILDPSSTEVETRLDSKYGFPIFDGIMRILYW